MMAARAHRETTRGEVFNLGGGMERTVSVIEMLRECERRTGMPLRLKYTDLRPGDQPLYISDTAKLQRMTGWKARRFLGDILNDIEGFWQENRDRMTGQPGHPSAFANTAAALVAEEVA